MGYIDTHAHIDFPEYQEDFEADERGELPKDLKRGVLSEDALYDLLEETERYMDCYGL